MSVCKLEIYERTKVVSCLCCTAIVQGRQQISNWSNVIATDNDVNGSDVANDLSLRRRHFRSQLCPPHAKKTPCPQYSFRAHLESPLHHAPPNTPQLLPSLYLPLELSAQAIWIYNYYITTQKHVYISRRMTSEGGEGSSKTFTHLKIPKTFLARLLTETSVSAYGLPLIMLVIRATYRGHAIMKSSTRRNQTAVAATLIIIAIPILFARKM